MNKSLEMFVNWNCPQIEWVVVDDKSTDDSYACLLKYRDDNPNLNISIYQNDINSGPGTTRNFGMRKAKGKYITFLDSDDFFDDSFLNTILPEIEKSRDCIIFDSYLYYGENNRRYWPLFRNNQPAGNIDVKDALVYVLGGTWGKIYKRDIIIDNHVLFLSQKISEDIPFTIHAISCCENIFYLKVGLYNYVQQSNSLIHNSSLADSNNSKNAFRYIRLNIQDKFPEETEALFVSKHLYSLALIEYDKMSKKEYLQLLRETEAEYPFYFKNKYLKTSTIQVRLVILCIRFKLYIMMKYIMMLKKRRDKRIYKAN